LVKNPKVLAFGIIENDRSCYFRQKWGYVAINHRPEARTSHPTYNFFAIDHILGFLVESISW
jgi:hypothetical protein